MKYLIEHTVFIGLWKLQWHNNINVFDIVSVIFANLTSKLAFIHANMRLLVESAIFPRKLFILNSESFVKMFTERNKKWVTENVIKK